MTTKNLTPAEVIAGYRDEKVLKQLQATLNELKKEAGSTRDRSAKITLNKKIKDYETRIEQLNESRIRVYYLNPQAVVDRLTSKLNSMKEEYKKALAEFTDRLNYNVADAIEWRADDLISKKERFQVAQTLLTVIEEAESAEAKLNAFVESFAVIKKESTNRIIMKSKRGGSRSSSSYANLVEDSQMAGLASILDEWQLAEGEYYLEYVQNWKILVEAGLLTEEK